MIHHYALLVENDKIRVPYARAVEIIETWTCADFDFVVSEAIATFQARFDFTGEYGLVFNSLGNCSAVGSMGAWVERVL